jgi:uncharacterized membrane protein
MVQKQTGRNAFVLLSLAFTFLLVLLRAAWTGQFSFGFLPWNLFLAWLPLLMSTGLRPGRPWTDKWNLMVLGLWLLFFPNAPYLITDLLHFSPRPPVPSWYDILLLFSAAWTGLLLGLLSLARVERHLLDLWSGPRVAVIMTFLLFLSAYGIYLGRVLRWNSWDLFTSPLSILQDTAMRVRHPLHHLDAWVVTGVMGGILCLVHYGVKQVHEHGRA